MNRQLRQMSRQILTFLMPQPLDQLNPLAFRLKTRNARILLQYYPENEKCSDFVAISEVNMHSNVFREIFGGDF
jgi:hypothetical protein